MHILDDQPRMRQARQQVGRDDRFNLMTVTLQKRDPVGLERRLATVNGIDVSRYPERLEQTLDSTDDA